MDLLTPDIGLIFWQTVVFTIVFLLLALFVWRPVSSALKAREHTISDSLDAAERAKEEMQQIKADNEYLLKEARAERDEILKQASQVAEQIKEDAKVETSSITEKMIADARIDIENEKKKALAEVKSLVSDLSLEIAEKVIREKLSDEASQKALVQKFLTETKAN
ncbi:MAG: F0F1 ATP synthase subunit B [Bacteroidota bacterium]